MSPLYTVDVTSNKMAKHLNTAKTTTIPPNNTSKMSPK